jgi:ATP phosphoribosyltransferase
MNESLTIAVSKGRILTECLPLLASVGVVPEENPETSRRLVIGTGRPGIRLLILRPFDVPTYVQQGAAEAGIAGKDVLMETPGDGLYEPLDLGIARCRMVLAGPGGAPRLNGRMRIATKYVNATRDYFEARGQQVEIVRLYGSMEIAPALGLADRIVDLVDTGRTLRDNGLVELETIARISSRLIVNKAAMKMKHAVIRPFIQQLAARTQP